MNRSESKYFNTAERMDKAFLSLLEKKDIEFITVKEICQTAGVNRSTFYLHYETISDLLDESVEYMNRMFLLSVDKKPESFVSKIKDCSVEELYLITPEYVVPYLEYIKNNSVLFKTALENSRVLGLNSSYEGMFKNVLLPILNRLGVNEKDGKYMIRLYIGGVISVVSMWLENDCRESIEYVSSIIINSIPKLNERSDKK